MEKKLLNRFPESDPTTFSKEAQDAIKAMNRAHEKLRAQKKALGHKFVIWKDGKAVLVDP